MLRLLAMLSPTALLAVGGLMGAVPAAGLAYLGGRTIGHHAGYVEGKAAMVAAVTKQNAVAADAARKAKSKVDECDEANGTWNQSTGECDR